jgi:hypothetical protein
MTISDALAWLRRNNKLFTFVGACLLFFTFIYKDVLLERQKRLLQIEDSAHITYLIRDSQNSIFNRIRLVQTTLRGLELSRSNNTGSFEDLKPQLRTLDYVIRDAELRVDDLSTNIENAIVFFKTLQEDSHFKSSKKAIDILQTLEKNKDETNNYRGALTGFHQEVAKWSHPELLTNPPSLQEQTSKLHDLQNSKIVDSSELAKLEENNLSSIKAAVMLVNEETNSAERRFAEFSFWSQFLYGAAFLFALCGQLLGIEGVRV